MRHVLSVHQEFRSLQFSRHPPQHNLDKIRLRVGHDDNACETCAVNDDELASCECETGESEILLLSLEVLADCLMGTRGGYLDVEKRKKGEVSLNAATL